MDDYRIPVMSKEVVIEFSGGVQTAGLVFIPTAAPDHDGPMRLVEWLNLPETFFPFKIHGGANPVLVNRDHVLSLTAYHDRDSGGFDELDGTERRAVRIETPHGTFSGRVVIDAPYNRHRVLDALNSGRQFVYLLDSGKEVHVNKRHIVKAMEAEAEPRGAGATQGYG